MTLFLAVRFGLWTNLILLEGDEGKMAYAYVPWAITYTRYLGFYLPGVGTIMIAERISICVKSQTSSGS